MIVISSMSLCNCVHVCVCVRACMHVCVCVCVCVYSGVCVRERERERVRERERERESYLLAWKWFKCFHNYSTQMNTVLLDTALLIATFQLPFSCFRKCQPPEKAWVLESGSEQCGKSGESWRWWLHFSWLFVCLFVSWTAFSFVFLLMLYVM